MLERQRVALKAYLFSNNTREQRNEPTGIYAMMEVWWRRVPE